jgi:hypothetical protein
MARAESEGKQPTPEAIEEANELARTILADLFKVGYPDWLPMIFRKGVSNDPAATMDATAEVPTKPTSVSLVPVTNHVEQPSPPEPSLFDPERADECAEAFKNRFAVTAIREGGPNVSGASTDAFAQSSTLSTPDPVANHSEQTPIYLYEPSLFDPEKADERAEAFMNGPGFPVLGQQEGGFQSSALSLPAPVANHSEQTSFYKPSEFNFDRVDGWGPYFSNFL